MEKLIYKHQNFMRTLSALDRSINVFLRTDIDEDIRETLVASLIKHFEMCYEAFLKYYLEIRYSQIADSPKQVFRQCFIAGLLDEQEVEGLLDISEARNTTTHTYDEEKAQEICNRIDSYYQIFQKISCISLEI